MPVLLLSVFTPFLLFVATGSVFGFRSSAVSVTVFMVVAPARCNHIIIIIIIIIIVVVVVVVIQSI